MLAAPGAAAATQPKLSLLARSFGGFSSLGPNTGAYDISPQELRLVTPGNPAGRPVEMPPRCRGLGISLPDRLLFCEDAPNFRFLDTDTGAVTPIDITPCGEQERVYLSDLGRYWMAGEYTIGYDREGDPILVPIFLNRTTGECRRFDRKGEGWRDPDRPNLPKRHAPTCRDRGRGRLLKSRRPGGGLDLVFCRSKRRTIHLCKVQCGNATLGRRTVAWLTRHRVHALHLSSGRRFSWRLSALTKGRQIDVPAVAFVRGRLYVDFALRGIPPGEPAIRIFSAQLH